MGLDVYGFAVLGIEISRDMFFKKTGTLRLCSKYGCTYEGQSKFCPDHGDTMREIDVEEPTPEFVRFCEGWPGKKKSPGEVWEEMMETTGGELGIFRCAPMQSAGDDDERIALGIKFGETKSNRDPKRCDDVSARDFFELVRSEGKIREVARKMGVDVDRLPVRVFTCVYLSY